MDDSNLLACQWSMGDVMGLIQPHTPNQGHRPWTQLRNKLYFSKNYFPLIRKNAGGESSLSLTAFLCFPMARGLF